MSGVNKVILIGYVGKDPETKQLEAGKRVSVFSLATSETFKDKSGNKKEVTEWHDIVCWNGLSDVVEKYVRKGLQLYIEGKKVTRTWEKDGIRRSRVEIVANTMQMIGGKKPETVEEPKTDFPEYSDDLPF